MSLKAERAPHVLVVDDERFIRDAIRLYLESSGFLVSTAEGRESALRAFHAAEVPVDVAILDLVMPETNGLDLLREFKDADPRVEVIIATGCGSMNSAVEALRLGAFDYITKPFVDFDEDLLKSVNKALAARRKNFAVADLETPVTSDPSERDRLLSIYDSLNRFVREHGGTAIGDSKWASIWDLARRCFHASAAQLVDRDPSGNWRHVRSWTSRSHVPPGVGTEEENSGSLESDLESEGPWAKVICVPLYGVGSGRVSLALYYKAEEPGIEDAPYFLLGAAVSAVLADGSPIGRNVPVTAEPTDA